MSESGAGRATWPSDEQIRSWIEANVGGSVREITRQPRWRPMWWVDVDRDGELLELCVRADRVDGTAGWPHRHEMVVLIELERAGIPVPHVYGWIDGTSAFVTDRLPGRSDFEGLDDAQHRQAIDEWLQIMVRMHRAVVQPFADAGIARASDPSGSGRIGIERLAAAFRAAKTRPDPMGEFAIGWLERNPLDNAGREAVIAWDAGQFHHQDGKFVGLLDFDVAHIGDPMMDLACLAGRDTYIGFGGLGDLYRRYEEFGGFPVDYAAITYYTIPFMLMNELTFQWSLTHPTHESDYTTNLAWCIMTNIWVCELIADQMGVKLPEPPAEPAEPEGAAFRTAPHDHMVVGLKDAANRSDDFQQYRNVALYRLSRHLRRLDLLADAVIEQDLDDLQRTLGHRPASWNAGEAELERAIMDDDGSRDEEFVVLLHRRQCRQRPLVGPAGSSIVTPRQRQRVNT